MPKVLLVGADRLCNPTGVSGVMKSITRPLADSVSEAQEICCLAI
jgi:hypothetical protein